MQISWRTQPILDLVTESSRVKLSMKHDKKMYQLCCLEISNVETSDVGQYKAIVKNDSGESQATINLTFEESVSGKAKVNMILIQQIAGIKMCITGKLGEGRSKV